MQTQNKKQSKGFLFFWFMGLMGKRLPIYLLAILISTLGMAFRNIANARIVEGIVTAAQTQNTEGLLLKVAMELLFFILSAFLWRVGIMRYNIEGKRGTAKLEKMIFSKVMRLPFVYYEENHSGDFISKLIFDTERAGDIYGSRLRRLLAAVISAIVYLIPMFCYNPQLTGCLLIISVLSFLVNSYFLKPMKAAGGMLTGQNSRMTESLTNILGGMELSKIFPVGEKLLGEYKEANDSYYKIQKKTNKLTGALESLNCMFDLLGALAFLGIGVWFVSERMVTIGELTAIYTLYGTFRYMFLDIGKYLPQMMNCIANVECLYEFLQLEEEPEGYVGEKYGKENQRRQISELEKNEQWAVVMEQVSFSYEEGRNILQNFSMKVEVGKCVALVGESGCGKSTIAKLLLGFYAPEQGSISIMGQNGKNSTLREMRDLIGYVPQEPYLYEVSIAENIAYGRSNTRPEEVPMEDIIAAAKTANAHDFIMRLPNGYQTIPGERGNTLSGGEKQRIAIARAVLKNAPILLLDEATSALDNESEQLVNEALDRACKGRTTIMIAHRQSTIAMTDEVIVVG